jgi:hypothetical protein
MLTDDEVDAMTMEERRELFSKLAKYNDDIVRETRTSGRRRSRIINVLVIACLGLIPWIVFLALTLPHSYQADHWTVLWVGFDIALLFALGSTAWAAWRRRQLVIAAALITGTMLVVDAWFDLVTDSSTRDLIASTVTAVCGELPLAALLFAGAFRLMRLTTQTAGALAGNPGEVTLRKAPILGIDRSTFPNQRTIQTGV